MSSVAIALLQAAALLLAGLQNNPNTPADLQRQIIATASDAIGASLQIAARDPQVKKFANGGYVPGIQDIIDATFTKPSGGQYKISAGVTLMEDKISFGDINADGFEDVAVLVRYSGDPIQYAAILKNEVGSLRHVASIALGENIAIADHRIDRGMFTLEYSKNGQLPYITARYRLIHNQLVKL